MTNSNGVKNSVILVASILAILAYVGDMISSWEYLQDNLAEEVIPQLMNAIVLIPAILGLWKFKTLPSNIWVLGGFILYAFLVVGGYLNVYYAGDPLAAGLPMVVIVIPFTLLFSGFLFLQIRKANKAYKT